MRAYTARSQEAFDEVASKRRIRYLLRPPLANPDFDIYSYELIVGVEKPALYIRARQLLSDGKRTLRDYGLSPGITDDKIIKILRLRLERNEWEGWDRLKPIEVPGLEILLPDARRNPYLYRYIYPDPE